MIASAGGARLAKLRSPICYETLRRLRSFLLMTDHPMFLEYDWTSNTYRSHLCGRPRRSRALSRRWPPRATHCILSVYGSEIRPMSAHGGSNSWNLSPSALTSPGWEVEPNRPIKRPRSPHSRLRQRRSPGRRVRGTRPTWRASGI